MFGLCTAEDLHALLCKEISCSKVSLLLYQCFKTLFMKGSFPVMIVTCILLHLEILQTGSTFLAQYSAFLALLRIYHQKLWCNLQPFFKIMPVQCIIHQYISGMDCYFMLDRDSACYNWYSGIQQQYYWLQFWLMSHTQIHACLCIFCLIERKRRSKIGFSLSPYFCTGFLSLTNIY